MVAQPEIGVRPGDVRARQRHMCPRGRLIVDEPACRPVGDPVADCIDISLFRTGGKAHRRLRHGAGGPVHRPKPLIGAGGFGRPHDCARLVDPYRLGHVHHVVEIGEMMVAIDQREVTRRRRLDKRPRHVGPRIHRDGDHHEIPILAVVIQRLPHGQVPATASPR